MAALSSKTRLNQRINKSIVISNHLKILKLFALRIPRDKFSFTKYKHSIPIPPKTYWLGYGLSKINISSKKWCPRVGLSKTTRLPNPPEILTDLIQKPLDPTPMTGQRQFPRNLTQFRRVSWQVLTSKPNFNRPDQFYHQKGCRSPSSIQFLNRISPDLARSR